MIEQIPYTPADPEVIDMTRKAIKRHKDRRNNRDLFWIHKCLQAILGPPPTPQELREAVEAIDRQRRRDLQG